eukprot:1195916-Prorocentrum_minimum.AAC.2
MPSPLVRLVHPVGHGSGGGQTHPEHRHAAALLRHAQGTRPPVDALCALSIGLRPPADALCALSIGLRPPVDALCALSIGLRPPVDALCALSIGLRPPVDALIRRANPDYSSGRSAELT